MRILILGGSGTLGTDLKKILVEKHKVFAPPHKDLDVLIPDQIRRAVDAVGADAIVNAAALADVDRCEREPELAYQMNADSVRYIAQACRERNLLLAHVSTDYVFPGSKNEPYVESDKTRPVQVYGKSKLAGERNALDLGAKAIVVRTSWLFGKAGKNFANKVVAAGRDGGEVKAVSDWFGSPTSTLDLSRAILGLIDGGASGIFHVVNPGTQSRLEQAKEILALMGSHKATLTPVESASILNLPAKRPHFTGLSSERLAAAGVKLGDRAAAVKEFLS